MDYFFRCMKQTSSDETIEKVFIGPYTSVKFNMGIQVPMNAHNKYGVHQKLKHVLTNGKKTKIKNDQNTKHQCRGKCQDCYPVYQPSHYLKEVIKSYNIDGLEQANYSLTGVNLCAHEHPNKPDQTHVELFFRNPKEPKQRIVINIHLNFTHERIDPKHKHHAKLEKLLAVTASTASIGNMLGKACQRGLEQLSKQHPALSTLSESNHQALGFRSLSQHRKQPPVHRMGLFNQRPVHSAPRAQAATIRVR